MLKFDDYLNESRNRFKVTNKDLETFLNVSAVLDGYLYYKGKILANRVVDDNIYYVVKGSNNKYEIKKISTGDLYSPPVHIFDDKQSALDKLDEM